MNLPDRTVQEKLGILEPVWTPGNGGFVVKMKVSYLGEKACEATHGPSQSKIHTDAPQDNGGKGSKFSPTDMLGAALGSCILTTMDILAEKEGKNISLKGAWAEVGKEMVGPPRRIGQLSLKIHMPPGIPAAERAFLQNIVHTCPVARSLHPELKIDAQVIYPD